ncbi:MAG: DUF2779 domain-containing protein [Sphingobium sp.]
MNGIDGMRAKRWCKTTVDPADLTSAVHRRVHQVTITGNPIMMLLVPDPPSMRGHSRAPGWISRPWDLRLPRWIGTRPYKRVPFQFSAHVKAQDGAIDHREFLILDGIDPHRTCAEGLAAMVPADSCARSGLCWPRSEGWRQCVDGVYGSDRTGNR